MMTLKQYFFVSLLILLVCALLLTNLLKYIERTIRSMAHFIDALTQQDQNYVFDFDQMGHPFDELNRNASKLKELFYRSKFEKEEKIYYLNAMIEHLNIGIIAYDDNGKIEFINQYAKKLLALPISKLINNINELPASLTHVIYSLKESTSQVFKLEEWQNNKLSFRSNTLQFKDKSIHLLSIHDIRSEMDEQEIDSWQRLIRVLTHEIMNSITPITSLSATVSALLSDSKHDSEYSEDIKTAVNTIQKRSSGLLAFVDSFRSLLKVSEPRIQRISLSSFIQTLQHLVEHRVLNEEIQWKIQSECDENYEFISDDAMLQQALINLIYNAFDAVSEKNLRIVTLTFTCDQNVLSITLTDNGYGIEKSNLDNIFIPFFTTKKSGNGIGLSIVKQIVNKLKGTITVSSDLNNGTTFEIRLQKNYYE